MFYDLFSDVRVIYTMFYTMFSNLFSDVTTLTDNRELAVIDSSMIVLHHPLSSSKHVELFHTIPIHFRRSQ